MALTTLFSNDTSNDTPTRRPELTGEQDAVVSVKARQADHDGGKANGQYPPEGHAHRSRHAFREELVHALMRQP